MTRSPGVDVVVIGGGVIGMSIAWQIARRGPEVMVVDDAHEARASWAGAGMLAPVSEVSYGEQALLALSLSSAEMYPQFVADLEAVSGVDVGFRRCGSLLIAVDGDDDVELSALFELQRRLGQVSERVDRRAARALEPALAPGIRSGLVVEGDHQVDNRRLVEALGFAGSRSGVCVERCTASVMVDAGRVVGVRLEDNEVIAAGVVVVAAGCWSASIDGLEPRMRPPVRPVKGQILRLRADPSLMPISRTVRGLVHGSRVYLVPRLNGEIVVGATVEERGFEATVTAGGVHDLLRDARTVVPEITECELVECWAGLRPGSPRNAPTLGRTPVDGLIMATGHHRNGILLAAVTASGISSVVCDGVTPPALLPFAPGDWERHLEDAG